MQAFDVNASAFIEPVNSGRHSACYLAMTFHRLNVYALHAASSSSLLFFLLMKGCPIWTRALRNGGWAYAAHGMIGRGFAVEWDTVLGWWGRMGWWELELVDQVPCVAYKGQCSQMSLYSQGVAPVVFTIGQFCLSWINDLWCIFSVSLVYLKSVNAAIRTLVHTKQVDQRWVLVHFHINKLCWSSSGI